MGRGRSSTNYTDAEKQLLLRAVAAVKPRRAACWHLVASHYNARREAGERDAHSLKRKFKTMATAREAEDAFNARARELMERIKARAASGEEDDDEDDDDAREDAREEVAAPPAVTYDASEVAVHSHRAPTHASALQYAARVPPLAPLLPGPPQAALPQATVAGMSSSDSAMPRVVGEPMPVPSEITQLLLVIREENAQREAARRIEREEAIAREQRWREEARELRRQEREEAAAREDRFRREMAEQRRRDREEATARHEQMMVILASVLKPSTGPANASPSRP